MPTLTRDQKICQAAAEALWNAATSERYDIAWCRSPLYKQLERAFVTSVRLVYGLGAIRAGQVRELLAEYGPDDSLTGTNGRGVASYVEFVKAHPGERF